MLPFKDTVFTHGQQHHNSCLYKVRLAHIFSARSISPIFRCTKHHFSTLAGVAQWIECHLRIKGSPVQFPVRAHVWVAGQVPSRGHSRQPHIGVSLSSSLPHSLKINETQKHHFSAMLRGHFKKNKMRSTKKGTKMKKKWH